MLLIAETAVRMAGKGWTHYTRVKKLTGGSGDETELAGVPGGEPTHKDET